MTAGGLEEVGPRLREALAVLPDDKTARRTQVLATLDTLIPEDTKPADCTRIARLVREISGVAVSTTEQHLRARRVAHRETSQAADAEQASAIKANRDAHHASLHQRGGLDLWDNSTRSIHWWVVPDPLNDRLAHLWSLDLTDPDASPSRVRSLPAPFAQVLYGSERRPLVYTVDDVPMTLSAEDLQREGWIAKCGGRLSGTRKMQDITREAFTVLAETKPVIKPRSEVKDGFVVLPPRGITPPGWQEVPEHRSAVELRTAWKEWAVLAAGQPGGILAHLAGAAIDSYYIGAGRRQSHAIDLVGRDVAIGKSTAGFCLAAMVGDPDQTLIPFDVASAISVTTLLGQVNAGAVFMDESQLFKATPEERALTVFRAAQGGQRTRSKSDGSGVNRGLPYSGIMFVTGNLRFVSDEIMDAVFPGLSRRYVVFTTDADRPVTESDASATRLKALALSAHGYLVPAVLARTTLADHEARVRRHWDRLTSNHPGRSAEVLRLLAGHLAGAEALDEFLGSDLASAAVAHAEAWLSNGAHTPQPVQELFLDKVRAHIATNIERWPHPIQYAAYRHPDWAQEDDDYQVEGVPIRKPVGVRDPGGQWFAILSRDCLVELCGIFDIADPDAVLKGLVQTGLLNVPKSVRDRGELQNGVTLGSLGGKRARVNAYDIRAPWHIADDSEDDGAPDDAGSGPDTPGSGPAVNPLAAGTSGGSAVNPFASDAPEPSGTAPSAQTRVLRPWIPNPLKRNAAGNFTGAIKTVNQLLELQSVKGRAQVHNHPYPTDDDIPEPLRILAKDQGTGVHDGFHRFVSGNVAPGTTITRLDRNAAYLVAIGSARLPLAGLTPYNGRGPEKQIGIYQVRSWPQLTRQAIEQDIPHPWGTVAPIRQGRDLWVPQALIDLGDETVTSGILEPFEVVRSLTGAPLQKGRSAYTQWRIVHQRLRDARAEAIESGDEETEAFLKSVYAKLVSTAGESGSNTRIWRPEIPPLIRATAFANVWRQSQRFRAAGVGIAALLGNDEIHIVGGPEVLFGATSGGEPVITQGRGLDQIKIKGGYTAGSDGDQLDEWEA